MIEIWDIHNAMYKQMDGWMDNSSWGMYMLSKHMDGINQSATYILVKRVVKQTDIWTGIYQ
jgi:hypothetical protein